MRPIISLLLYCLAPSSANPRPKEAMGAYRARLCKHLGIGPTSRALIVNGCVVSWDIKRTNTPKQKAAAYWRSAALLDNNPYLAALAALDLYKASKRGKLTLHGAPYGVIGKLFDRAVLAGLASR